MVHKHIATLWKCAAQMPREEASDTSAADTQRWKALGDWQSIRLLENEEPSAEP